MKLYTYWHKEAYSCIELCINKQIDRYTTAEKLQNILNDMNSNDEFKYIWKGPCNLIAIKK
jgi:hypothetical protein